MLKAKPIWDIHPIHGEGPLWDPETQQFYCVDLLEGIYYKVDWNTGISEKHNVGQELGVMSLRENNGIVVAVRDGFGTFDESSNSLKLVKNPPEKEVSSRRMNDGAVSPDGRFFAGTMEYDGENATGSLYRLDGDLSWEKVDENLFVPNGMGWNLKGDVFYMIDSNQNACFAYDYDPTDGSISNRRVHIQWPRDEFPDGMTIDAEGGFWVAMWLGSKISHFDSKGKWIEDIAVPALYTTSCCFGGPDLDTLLITSSNLNHSEEEKIANPIAGRVFSIKLNVKGRVEPKFKG